MTLAQLKTKALQSCERRRHTMGAWNDYDRNRSFCNCLHCGKEVYVVAFPAPNEIDISGEAVALNCEY